MSENTLTWLLSFMALEYARDYDKTPRVVEPGVEVEVLAYNHKSADWKGVSGFNALKVSFDSDWDQRTVYMKLLSTKHIQPTKCDGEGQRAWQAVAQGQEPEKNETLASLVEQGYFHKRDGRYIPCYGTFTIPQLQATITSLWQGAPRVRDMLGQMNDAYLAVLKNHTPEVLHGNLIRLAGREIDTLFISRVLNTMLERHYLQMPAVMQPLTFYVVHPE